MQARSNRLGEQKNQLEQALLISRSGCTLVEGALTNADDQVVLLVLLLLAVQCRGGSDGIHELSQFVVGTVIIISRHGAAATGAALVSM